MEPFYAALGEGEFQAGRATAGPWHHSVQHGGPPSALLLREIERCAGLSEAFGWKRVTIEFIRPVPRARVSVEVEPVHQGRKAQIYAASLESGGKVVARARALAVRRLEVQVPDQGTVYSPPERGPEASPFEEAPFFPQDFGYHKAMDTRFARGDFGLGPSRAWFRMRVPLIDGEAPSPIQRVMLMADCVSGTSRVLDNQAYSFVNADLTVHLVRAPIGEWIYLDGTSSIGALGSGLASGTLFDTSGRFGQSLQTLVVAPI